MKNKAFTLLLIFISTIICAQNVGTSYCGPYEFAAPIVLNNMHDITISGLEITNPEGHCIQLSNCSNITIENCLLRDATGNAVNINNSSNITVTNCKMESIATGVYAQGESSKIQVLYNTCINVLGPYPRGQLTQFNSVSGEDNKINYNVAENFLGESYPEDIINIFNSNGTANSPIEIKGNWIRGGGPSTSGGGILVGDSGGSYVTVEDNILVNPGQYGLAIASGENMKIINNTVFGEQQDFTNVGLYVWNQYETACGNHTVSGNRINWTNKEGNKNSVWDASDASEISEDRDPCGIVEGWETNVWLADIDASILPDIIDVCTKDPNEENLIAHYEFNNNVLDSTENELHGANNDAVSYNSYNNYTTAIFNGIDSRIDIPTDELLTPENFSFTAWIKPNENNTGNRGLLKSADGSGYDTGWRLSTNEENISGLITTEREVFETATIKGLVTNEWNYVAFTYNGNNIKIYINDLEPVTTVYPGAIFYDEENNSSFMSIGHSNGTSYFSGEIDDLKLYNIAFDENEIVAYYEEQKELYTNTTLNVIDTTEEITTEILIYPNPSTDAINIIYPNFVGNEKVQISDINGRILIHKVLESANTIFDISKLNKGMYHIKITDSKGKEEIQPMIVK